MTHLDFNGLLHSASAPLLMLVLFGALGAGLLEHWGEKGGGIEVCLAVANDLGRRHAIGFVDGC